MYSRIWLIVPLIFYCSVGFSQSATNILIFPPERISKSSFTWVGKPKGSTGNLLQFRQPLTNTNLLNLAKKSLSVKTPQGLVLNGLILVGGLWFFQDEFFDRNRLANPSNLESVFCATFLANQLQPYVPSNYLPFPFSTRSQKTCLATASSGVFFDSISEINRQFYEKIAIDSGCATPEVSVTRSMVGFSPASRYVNGNVSNPAYPDIAKLARIDGTLQLNVSYKTGSACSARNVLPGSNYTHATNDLTRSGTPFTDEMLPPPLTANEFAERLPDNAVHPLILDDFNRWMAGLPSVLPWGTILRSLCGGVVCTPSAILDGIADGALNPNYSSETDLLRDKDGKEPTDKDIEARLNSEFPARSGGVTTVGDIEINELSVPARVVSCPTNIWSHNFTFFKGMTKTVSVSAVAICTLAPIISVFVIFVFSVLSVVFIVRNL